MTTSESDQLSSVLGTTLDLPAQRRSNPYVGPRAFRRGEPFYGRNRDADALVNTLLSSRIVLLHSPSGAGKTSLIQTSVVPEFERRHFAICVSWQPQFSALRVNLPVPDGVRPRNRYVYSLVNGLVGSVVDADAALDMTIEDALTEFDKARGAAGRQLLVLDQLEEVLTLAPGDIKGQTEFFRQLGTALDSQKRWAVLSMREDYMGGLDRYRRFLPGQLRSTFRLDLLDEASALRAIRKPTKHAGVSFDRDAAEMLVADLRHIGRSADADGSTSPYVEPVLLQVVCYGLFEKLSKARRQEFERITITDVTEFRPFDKALSKYYRRVVQSVARQVADSPTEGGRRRDAQEIEKAVRDWVGQALITAQHTRRPTRTKPAIPEPDAALSQMRALYLIRDDPRPHETYFELAHDMLVGPVLEDNRAWLQAKMPPWVLSAYLWQRSGRSREHLLTGPEFRAARSQRRHGHLTENENAFMAASADAWNDSKRMDRIRAVTGVVGALLVVSLVLNVVLLVLLLGSWR